MDQAWLRFCLMAAMAALGLFLRQTFVIGAPRLRDRTHRSRDDDRAGLHPGPGAGRTGQPLALAGLALGIAAAVAANLLIAPTIPRGCSPKRSRTVAGNGGRDRPSPGVAEPGFGRDAARRGGRRAVILLLKSAEVAQPAAQGPTPAAGALITLAEPSRRRRRRTRARRLARRPDRTSAAASRTSPNVAHEHDAHC